jgi:O-antigen/teichoic acid export membrane protein
MFIPERLTLKTPELVSRRFLRLGREFFWVALGQVAATIGALVGVRLLTGVLNPQTYGELALGMTAAMLINQLVMGPLSNASLRFFAPARESGELSSFLAALRGLLVRATGIVLLIASMVYLGLLLIGYFDWFWLGVAAFGFALLSGYNSILDGMQNAARQRAIVAWHQALASWSRFLGAAGLVVWLGATSAIAMLGYGLASMLVLLSQTWFFKRQLLPTEESRSDMPADPQQWSSKMFGYAWPFASWGIFTWAQMASDRWALQIFTSTREVGLYAVLYQLGYFPITILTGLVVQLVAPVFFQQAGDASDTFRMRQVHALNWRLTLSALILAVVMTVVVLALHGFVFRLLVASEYQSVSWLLPGMVLSGGFFATGQFAVISLLINTESRRLLFPKVFAGTAGIMLNFLGASWFGVPGVVAANLVVSAGYLLWILCIVRVKYNQFAYIDNVVAPLKSVY